MEIVESETPLDGYFNLNLGMYQESIYGSMFGSRRIANGLILQVSQWNEDLPTLEEFGYPSQKKRMDRLRRNYFEAKSHDQGLAHLARLFGKSEYTGVPLSYTTNKIKQTGNLGCIVGGALTWKAKNAREQELQADFLLRISETVKVFPADMAFLARCVKYCVNPYMYSHLTEVRFHFAGAYVIPIFFPQLVAMAYKFGRLDEGITLQNTSFGRACKRGLQQACDLDYQSKWKPHIRILNFFRRSVPESDFPLVQSKVS